MCPNPERVFMGNSCRHWNICSGGREHKHGQRRQDNLPIGASAPFFHLLFSDIRTWSILWLSITQRYGNMTLEHVWTGTGSLGQKKKKIHMLFCVIDHTRWMKTGWKSSLFSVRETYLTLKLYNKLNENKQVLRGALPEYPDTNKIRHFMGHKRQNVALCWFFFVFADFQRSFQGLMRCLLLALELVLTLFWELLPLHTQLKSTHDRAT